MMYGQPEFFCGVRTLDYKKPQRVQSVVVERFREIVVRPIMCNIIRYRRITVETRDKGGQLIGGRLTFIKSLDLFQLQVPR
jgi:hypothetical protein